MHPRTNQIHLHAKGLQVRENDDLNGERIACNPRSAPRRIVAKRKASRTDKTKQLAVATHQVPKFYLRPSTTTIQERMATRLVTHLKSVHPHGSWLALLPQHIGHHQSADHAIRALTHALEFNKCGRSDFLVARAAYNNYGKALEHLRQDLTSTDGRAISDGPLICTAVLAMVEISINDLSQGRRKDTLAHWSGLSAILLGRPANYGMSDVARGIMYSLSNELISMSMATNTVSPFDSERWLSLDPGSLHLMSEDVFILRKRAHRLILSAPRFMRDLRASRESRVTEAKEVAALATFAKQKLDLLNSAAETSVLRRTRVRQVPSQHSQTALLKYDLSFHTSDDFEAAITYWTYSMGLTNCCLELLRLHPEQADGQLDPAKLRSGNDRMYANILMSWHYAVSLGPFAMVMGAKALLMHWQYLRSVETWRGLEARKVIEWILPREVTEMNPWRVSAAYLAQFDAAADMLVGGPLRGYLSLSDKKAVNDP